MSGVEVYDEDASDQPVDYSKKYVERNALPQTRLMVESSRTGRPSSSKKVSDAKEDLFYAETDLDQPTDYSLRYAEDDTDDEEKPGTEYFPGSEQEDTIKTYCTEGTPYETPLNFSTATSMSDLRIDDTKKGDLLKKAPKKAIEMSDRSPASSIEQAVVLHCDEPDSPVIKEEEELEENPKDTTVLNPGQVTPEKIVSYYEEGKSHGLSRANSLSSLNSAVTPQNNIPGVISKTDSPDSANKEELENGDYGILRLNSNEVELPSGRNSLPVNKSSPRVLDKEGKMVTFGSQDDYAEETPLMFSRCSSLGSLSGFEQHSIHDDHSSVVSDFSRTVSDGDEDDEDMLAACINMGMQTNRYRQSLQTLNTQKPIQSEPPNVLGPYQRDTIPSRLELHVPVAPAETSTSTSKTSKPMEIAVAPDTVHVYCTEDTPADISPVGSQSNLSALSMPSVQEDTENIEHDKSTEIDCHRNDLFDDESSNLSGEDEKILDECIQSGMPKARQITSPPVNSIPFIKKPETLSHRFNVYGTPSSSPVETSQTNKNPIFVKSLGSAPMQHPDELSDDSPNHSDDEAILTECIQSAMPKARFNMPSSIRSSLSQPMENPKALNMRTPSTSSAFFQSGYAEQRKNLTKKFLPSEDNVGLSEEEDIILAQCIRSGMPKVLSSMSSTMAPAVKRFEPNLKTIGNFSITSSPSYPVNKAYTARNATLHVPSSSKPANVDTTDRFTGNATSGNFNCFPRKTMNNLVQTSGQTSRSYHNNTRERINNSSYCAQRSPHHRTESENSNSVDNLCMSLRSRVIKYGAPVLNRIENDDDDSCRNVVKTNAVPSRHSSVNSLSEESSLISTEEWALLEFCITSGMPRNKYPVKGIKPNEDVISGGHDDCESISEDNYSVCSYNSYVCKI